MTTTTPLRTDRRPDLEADVDAVLGTLLERCRHELTAIAPELGALADAVVEHAAGGGKRIRPRLVGWGARAAGGADPLALAQVGAAVELIHAYALAHDDVMDRSPRRRGRPSLHRVLEQHHRAASRGGESAWFGVGAAILAGDLLSAWADDLVADLPVDPPRLLRIQHLVGVLRRDAIAGQYLDLWQPRHDDDVLRVALLKSGRYSITHPLLLGATLAGRLVADETTRTLETYGDAIGVAFQLCDDLLGVFGDPAETGKSNLDDLRQGKRTMLVTATERRADPAQLAVLREALGDPSADLDTLRAVREVMVDCGALAAVQAVIDDHRRVALAALSTTRALDAAAVAALTDLAERLTRRCR